MPDLFADQEIAPSQVQDHAGANAPLADRLVELHVIEAISDETVRRTLGETPAQAVARRPLVHRAGRGGLRQPDGGRAGSLRRGGRHA